MILALAVGVITALELVVATRTFGTDDVFRWIEFADGVARVGPVDVYGLRFGSLYNHPPLAGYLLQAVNSSTRIGLAFPLAIRLPAIGAGAATPFLVLELLRRRRDLSTATVSSLSVAISPALFAVAGFHGNTDPVIVMLSVLAVYLLVDRRKPSFAGITIAVAIGVKIVPVILLPVMFACAFLAGRRSALRFTLAAGVTMVVTWAPALSRHWGTILNDVLGYRGGSQLWGWTQVGRWVGDPPPVEWLAEPGRFLIVVIVAGVPAGLVMWRPRSGVEASALALTGLLALSPGFGMQYLAWAIAPAYLLAPRIAGVFNALASLLAIIVYTRWSGGLPWFLAISDWLTRGEIVLAFATWVALLAVIAAGIRLIARPGLTGTSEQPLLRSSGRPGNRGAIRCG